MQIWFSILLQTIVLKLSLMIEMEEWRLNYIIKCLFNYLYVNFYNLQRLLKNGQKSDSFAAHFVHHFNITTSHTELRKCMTLKVLKQLNPIDAMQIFTKSNCNLCMQECLTILKMIPDKRVTVMNKNSEIYGACRHKTCFHRFCLSTDDPVFHGWKGVLYLCSECPGVFVSDAKINRDKYVDLPINVKI